MRKKDLRKETACHCEKGAVRSEGRSNPSYFEGHIGGMRLAYGGQVDRSGRAHAMTRQYYAWAGFTGIAMVTPALHRHANRLQRLPCRQSLGFEGNLSLQVNQASWMR